MPKWNKELRGDVMQLRELDELTDWKAETEDILNEAERLGFILIPPGGDSVDRVTWFAAAIKTVCVKDVLRVIRKDGAA